MSFGRLNLMTRVGARALSGRESAPLYIHNRNPRNLEKLCIARKPKGYHLEKPGLEYWHRLKVTRSSKHVTVSVEHNSGAVPIQVSTKEWAVAKHLYSTSDVNAYINLGRVLGRRCLETGITEMACFINVTPGGRIQALIEELKKSGVSLTEPPQYVHPRPSDSERPEKPWEIHLD